MRGRLLSKPGGAGLPGAAGTAHRNGRDCGTRRAQRHLLYAAGLDRNTIREMVSRRNFLAATGVAPFTARSYTRVIGANERLNIGVIGCGGMATGHMTSIKSRMLDTDNVQMIAVCDLWDKRLDAAAELTGGKQYKRVRGAAGQQRCRLRPERNPGALAFEKILIDAIDAGKHVY